MKQLRQQSNEDECAHHVGAIAPTMVAIETNENCPEELSTNHCIHAGVEIIVQWVLPTASCGLGLHSSVTSSGVKCWQSDMQDRRRRPTRMGACQDIFCTKFPAERHIMMEAFSAERQPTSRTTNFASVSLCTMNRTHVSPRRFLAIFEAKN